MFDGPQAWGGVFPPTAAGDLLIVAGGITLQFAVACHIEWYRKLLREAAVRKLYAPAGAATLAPAAMRRDG